MKTPDVAFEGIPLGRGKVDYAADGKTLVFVPDTTELLTMADLTPTPEYFCETCREPLKIYVFEDEEGITSVEKQCENPHCSLWGTDQPGKLAN